MDYLERLCSASLVYSSFLILVNVWQIQAIGAFIFCLLRLIIFTKDIKKKVARSKLDATRSKKQSGFWMTVLKVELADIAFAIDSMLAAVALAVTFLQQAGLTLVELMAVNFLLCS